MRRDALRQALLMMGIVFAGCHTDEPRRLAAAPADQASVRTTAPAAHGTAVVWENSGKGVRLTYPSDWKPRKNPDYELTLIPIGAGGDERRITLDVPDLPPHLPWMIQMNRIEHDYLQDLKKAHPDLKLQDDTEAKVPNSIARLVRSNWHEGDLQHDDVVLLIIHASAVYILDARTDHARLSDTRRTFDSVRSSLQWTK